MLRSAKLYIVKQTVFVLSTLIHTLRFFKSEVDLAEIK